MQQSRLIVGLGALAASSLILGGCSGEATSNQSSVVTSVSSSASAAGDEKTHNDADAEFAQGMIPHHQQAVEMSDMLLGKQGVDAAVVALAKEIKAAQAPEIAEMQVWLEQWNDSASPAATTPAMSGHNMPGHDMGDMSGMGSGGHGMMSDADMAALQNAQGSAAGRLFLEQMIEHHKGAITMAQQEIDKGRFAAAVEMARGIVSSQQVEIDEMRTLLKR